MTTKQMRELDAWICINVFGWQERDAFRGSQKLEGQTFWVCDGKQVTHIWGRGAHTFRHCTTDPDTALEVLKRCAKKCDQISIVECEGTWAVCEGDGNHAQPVAEGEAPTLELAICLFAKALFSKQLFEV